LEIRQILKRQNSTFRRKKQSVQRKRAVLFVFVLHLYIRKRDETLKYPEKTKQYPKEKTKPVSNKKTKTVSKRKNQTVSKRKNQTFQERNPRKQNNYPKKAELVHLKDVSFNES